MIDAIKECNFNKGLGPDRFCGSTLRVDDPRDEFTNNIVGQILDMLNEPSTIPEYLKEGRLIPLSKNKGKDMA